MINIKWCEFSFWVFAWLAIVWQVTVKALRINGTKHQNYRFGIFNLFPLPSEVYAPLCKVPMINVEDLMKMQPLYFEHDIRLISLSLVVEESKPVWRQRLSNHRPWGYWSYGCARRDWWTWCHLNNIYYSFISKDFLNIFNFPVPLLEPKIALEYQILRLSE